MNVIYLDNAATTELCEAAKKKMSDAERDLYFNSAAQYSQSLTVKKAIDDAAKTIKGRIDKGGVGRLIFTSGATEANNMIILGLITNPRKHLVVVSGEHSSVHAPSVYLKSQGFQVDYVPLLPSGGIDIDAVKTLIKFDTALFVFGMVNSEVGTLQNSAELARAVKSVNPQTHIHCDAVQAFAKFDFDAGELGLDSCVISAHKIHGPKGIGALWLKNSSQKNVTLKPLMYGGEQQLYRPGTQNNAAIVGFAAAVSDFNTQFNYNKVKALHVRLVKNLPEGCYINGLNQNPYITNIGLGGVLGSTVMNALSSVGICVGLGSACAASSEKNRTLIAMGIPEQKTKQVLRISFSAYNTENDVDNFLKELGQILAKIK